MWRQKGVLTRMQWRCLAWEGQAAGVQHAGLPQTCPACRESDPMLWCFPGIQGKNPQSEFHGGIIPASTYKKCKEATTGEIFLLRCAWQGEGCQPSGFGHRAYKGAKMYIRQRGWRQLPSTNSVAVPSRQIKTIEDNKMLPGEHHAGHDLCDLICSQY